MIGLVLLQNHDRALSLYSVLAFATYLYAIGCYEDWAGISSFGNRFFVSLTPLFILGLASFFDWLAETLQERRAAMLAAVAHRCFDRLEYGADLSVGHASDTGARTDFLA